MTDGGDPRLRPGGDQRAVVAELTDGEWHRLHPATPLLKGGIAVVVLLGIVANNLRELLFESFVPGGGRRGDDPVVLLVESGLLLPVVGGVLLVLLVMVAAFWASWRVSTFRVTDEVVEIRTGVLFRRERRAPLDRIQGINVQRPFLPRLLGAAKLQVSQAGDDANVDLAYLRSASADELRREILRRAGGARGRGATAPAGRAPASGASGTAVPSSAGGVADDRAATPGSHDLRGAPEVVGHPTGPAAAPGTPSARTGHRPGSLAAGLTDAFADHELDDEPPRTVVRMRLGRLVGSTVLSGATVFIVAAVVAVVVSVAVSGEWVLLAALLPALLGSVGFYGRRLSKSLRFSLADTRDGIRVSYGLLSTTTETLPPGRVHSVRVTQPLLWRPFGWWQVSINRASKSSTGGADGQSDSSLLPVGDEDDVRRVLGLVLPELVGAAAADEQFTTALVGDRVGDAAGAGAGEVAGGAAGVGPGRDAAALVEHRDRVAGEQADRTLSVVAAGLASSGSEGGFTTSPRRARVLRWASWRRNGFRTAPGAVLLRTGAVWRQLVVVPLPRVQSVSLAQGPVLRRLRLARVHVHTVAGPVSAEIGALDEHDARGFFDDVARLAVAAARADRTHRWLDEAAGEAAGATGATGTADATGVVDAVTDSGAAARPEAADRTAGEARVTDGTEPTRDPGPDAGRTATGATDGSER